MLAPVAVEGEARVRAPAGGTLTFDKNVEGYCAEAACAEARRCLRCDLER